MTTLVEKITWLYPELNSNDFISTIIIVCDENGERIHSWNHPTLPRPTREQLDTVQPPPPDIEGDVIKLVQQKLDQFAQTRGYDSILSACTYATSKVPKFQLEGQYCVDMRDQYWSRCYEILADVKSGVRQTPAVEQVMSELPLLQWPA